jgi:hypothetical protein
MCPWRFVLQFFLRWKRQKFTAGFCQDPGGYERRQRSDGHHRSECADVGACAAAGQTLLGCSETREGNLHESLLLKK